MGDVLHQFDDGLAGAALAREQACLIGRDAIEDCPFAFGNRPIVPIGHIEPCQRRAFFLVAKDRFQNFVGSWHFHEIT
jgi:hypothetical protein